MDAFIDAAFAFAVTLLVISIDAIPTDADGLIAALKTVPAFAGSFLLVVLFWDAHGTWSSRYGLSDRGSKRLGLLLVFLVLVFVYPLRMVFAALFQWLSAGYLDAGIRFGGVDDLRLIFAVFAVAFGSMGATLAALYGRVWRQRTVLALDQHELWSTRSELWRYRLIPIASAVSLLSALNDRLVELGVPGLCFFLLLPLKPIIRRLARRPSATVASPS